MTSATNIKCCQLKCEESLSCLSSYKVHFRVIHKLNNQLNYNCTYQKCEKIFSSQKGLFEHLKKQHKFPDKNTSLSFNHHIDVDIISNKNDQIFDIVDTVHKSQSLVMTESSESSENNDDKDRDIERKFEDIFFKFLMDLHSNSHLTKDIIWTLFRKIKQNILDSVMDISNTQTEVKSLIDNAYHKMNTQHKFDHRLKEQDFLTSGNVIFICKGNIKN